MSPLSWLLRHLSSPHESILIGIHVTSIIHSYLLVKTWNKFGDAFPRYFHGKWTLQIVTLPYLILKLKVYIQLRHKSCYEFFFKYVMLYHIYIYIYIYIISQSSEKIKLESIMNFNWSLIVNHVSHIIFNICAKWIIECKKRKVNI